MKETEIKLEPSEILFLVGNTGLVGILKIGSKKTLFIGTPDNDEIALFLEKDDIIAISTFEKGKKYEKGIKAMAYITREMESPIIVLPKNHPSSKRLNMVLSVGDSVNLDCDITPGTHPEQNILCSCDSLSGLKINTSQEGVIITGEIGNYKIEKI